MRFLSLSKIMLLYVTAVMTFSVFSYDKTRGTPPEILVQPIDVNVKTGDTAVFVISVSGDSLTFQWQRDSANGVFANYTSPSVVQADSILKKKAAITDTIGRSYRCIVSNPSGSDTSNAAKLSMKSPPTIVTQPISDTVAPGAACTFNVSATSIYPPMSFQWQRSKTGISMGQTSSYVNITGATDSVYVVTAVADTEHGYYFRCAVTDSAGTNYSNAARLFLAATAPPAILTDPRDTTVKANDSTFFKISLSGSYILGFEWWKDSAGVISKITGGGGPGGFVQLDSMYKIRRATVADSGKKFMCIVINSAGRDSSTWATLHVTSTGIINQLLSHGTAQFIASPQIICIDKPIHFLFNTQGFTQITLLIYSQKGRVIYSDSWNESGNNTGTVVNDYSWNLRSSNGVAVGSGAYIAVLRINGALKTRIEKTTFQIVK